MVVAEVEIVFADAVVEFVTEPAEVLFLFGVDLPLRYAAAEVFPINDLS